MINRLSCYFIILFQLFSFQSCHGEYMTKLDKTLNRVAEKSAKEIEAQFSFLTFAGMGGSLSEDNEKIVFEKIIFNCKKKITKEEGVFLLSEIVSRYLENIHSEKNMQDYLKEHSFTYKNVHVTIFIRDEKGEELFHPDMRTLVLMEEEVHYRTFVLADNGYPKVKSSVKEPYEEALKRISHD